MPDRASPLELSCGECVADRGLPAVGDEGTHDIHALILGRAIAGIAAFQSSA